MPTQPPEVPIATATASSTATTDAAVSLTPAATAPDAGPWFQHGDGGTRYTCQNLRCPLPAPQNEAFKVLKADCKGLEDNLRPERFQEFMTCMMAQNNTRNTCDLMLVGTSRGECLENWNDHSRIDPATEPVCKRVLAACSKKRASTITLADCQAVLSAASARGERKMIACMTEYCDDGSVCYMVR